MNKNSNNVSMSDLIKSCGQQENRRYKQYQFIKPKIYRSWHVERSAKQTTELRPP